MSAAATDWLTVAELSLGFALFLLVVYVALKRAIDGAPLEEAPRCCLRCGWPHAVRELTTGRLDCGGCLEPWNPGHAVHPNALPDDDIDVTVVDAQPTPLPLEDAEHIRCAFCHAPLSSLTQDHCWVCEAPNDRSAA